MKKLPSLLNVILLIYVTTNFTACSIFDKADPCDDTVKPEISAGIKATIHVLDKDRNPIANQQVNLYLYKEPCGAATKGLFDFSGQTNALGIRETSVTYYNLRNEKDMVWVDAHAVNLGNGSATADSEYASYEYNDFIVGIVKEVHVYIYRSF